MSDKIINFQQRRELEAAIAGFAQARNELDLTEAARQIVHNYPNAAVLAALLKHLDTSSSQVRGGLGRLAGLLPQETVLEALRTFAANRGHTPLARMTAAAIAEHFLGVELPAALTADLQDTHNAAFQSLLDAIEQGKRNRRVLLEYVQQMRELDDEVAFLVLDALKRVQPADRVELLRLLAQDKRPQVAQAGLAALEQLAATADNAQALRALHTLQYALPPEQAAVAERSLRKLRMAGRRYEPPAAVEWRSLLSPAEPNGNQTVWLTKQPQDDPHGGVLLGFTVNMSAGIVRFFGSEQIAGAALPPPKPVGEMLTVENDSGGGAVVLEAPFDYGRWLVAEAQRAQWAAPSSPPLPDELQLYNDHVWQFAPPQIEATLQRCWQPAAAAEIQADLATLTAATAALFAHPVMEEWTLPAGALLQATPAAAQLAPNRPLADMVAALLREIARWPESAALPAALAQGLRGQAAWLHLAGQAQLAQQAQLLADATPHLPLAKNPVLVHLLTISLAGQMSTQSPQS